ncbi:hypothetical protein ACU5EH_25620 [Aliivibrio salmonicida]|uniref:hypothetical protein n=1 Tax=Aliivibrio salmonicida TaxID=40269 RepID=UPI00406C9F7A
MFNPIFNPQVTPEHKDDLHALIECVLENIIPNEIKIYAYRIGAGCFHVMKFDNQLDITITDGHVDIPDRKNCLDSLRVGHIQIGVLDCMDVTYTIIHIIEQIKNKNNQLTHSYQTQ